MFKDILVHIKYPYAVFIIMIVWLGTLSLYLIDEKLPIILMVVCDSVLTAFIARHAMN
jgi:hypothetical protein